MKKSIDGKSEARRPSGRADAAAAVDAADHGVRRSAGKRFGRRSIGREGIKALQRNWIGRSTGAEVNFDLPDTEKVISESVKWMDQSRCRIVEDTDVRAPDGLHDAAGHACSVRRTW